MEAGKSGPFTSDGTGAMTGFTVRKWLNPNMPQALVLEAHSEQPFVLMRYAEILLNAAEAASELANCGDAAPSGITTSKLLTMPLRQFAKGQVHIL